MGAGQVILTAPPYLQSNARDQLLAVGTRLFDWLEARFAVVRVAGPPVEYIVNQTANSVIVTLLNHSGSEWDGSISTDTASTVSAVREYTADQDVSSVTASGATVQVVAQVPPYDLRIYAIEFRTTEPGVNLATQPDRMYRPGPSPLEPASSARERIVVFGASGHARVVMDICRLEGSYEVVGLLDSYKSRGIAYCGHEVIGSWQDLPELVSSGTVSGAIVAIGDNFSRARIVANIRGVLPDFRFVTAVHPSAQVARDVILGAGSVVMAGAVVNPGSEVGEFCIVNTRASLDHECVMGDYSSLGPGRWSAGASVSARTRPSASAPWSFRKLRSENTPSSAPHPPYSKMFPRALSLTAPPRA